MTRLEAVEKQRSNLLRQLDELDAERYKLRLEKWGIEIGMVVRDKKGTYYKVTRARFIGSDDFKPWVIGNMKKKDGTFGVERTVYGDWEKV